MRRHALAVLAVSAAVAACAGSPAWPAVAGTASGSRPPGAGDASAAGSWGRAVKVPGLAALNKGNAQVESVSCASPGNCAAGGYCGYRSDRRQGFVADERNGVWGRAVGVPGLAALNQQTAKVESVSCASAGDCASAGYYTDRHDHTQGFGVTQTR